MSTTSLLLWVAGAILIAVGYVRGRRPWSRYLELKQGDANAARYGAWRGGVRGEDDERTGASVAMEILRRQARVGALIALGGFALVFAGFLVG